MAMDIIKPKFEDTHCPRCGDSDGITSDEAVQMVAGEGKYRRRVVWCAAGHISIIDADGKTVGVELAYETIGGKE